MDEFVYCFVWYTYMNFYK